MNKHIEYAKELRNQNPMVSNCAQTILKVYAQELGLSEQQAANIASNFGGGMKCGLTCGAISAGLMVLGAKGIDSPQAAGGFVRKVANNHDGLVNCADLLKANAQKGGVKKVHCDGMIYEAIEILDAMVEEVNHG